VVAMPGALAAKRKRGYDEICGVVSDNPPANQGGGCLSDDGAVKHTLLSQYYPRLRTLRAYVLEKLPSSSRLRRRKISSVGSPRDTTVTDAETQLCRLLDSTLVGSHAEGQPRAGTLEVDGRWQKWLDFSQTGDESYVSLSDGVSAAYCSQSEVGSLVHRRGVARPKLTRGNSSSISSYGSSLSEREKAVPGPNTSSAMGTGGVLVPVPRDKLRQWLTRSRASSFSTPTHASRA